MSHTLPVSAGERWQVILHDDDVNPFPVVHYLLGRIFGFDADKALEMTTTVHQRGGAVVGVYDREEAEAVTVGLLRFGLLASFGRA